MEFDVTSEGWNVSYSGTANVTLKGRTFTKGEWSGFCLPFDASKETLDAAFGEGCYSLQAYSSFADNKIQFRKVTEADGGTPYFIYVNKTVENPKFDNVTFVSDVNLGYGGYSADWRGTTTISANLQIRGFYYKKANYNLYNNSSDQTNNAYYLSGDGILQDVRKREYTDSPLGIDVCILITGYSSSFQKPTVVFEEDDVTNSGGTSGGGSGGESGSTDDPTFKDVINTDIPVQKESYNGQSISFDGKHSFYGTLFTADVVDKSTDYLFSNDVYATDASLAQATSNTENGARAFIRVSDGATPAIKIQTADEASEFTYDVTNDYVHTAWCQYDNQTKNVTIENRGTLHEGEWNMICLPFKLAAADYKKAFGEDVEVAEFTGVTKSEGGELVSFNLAYINEKNGMKAATPYLIKPSKPIDTKTLKFEGVKVSTKTTAEQAAGDENCKLIGTLQPTLLNKGHQQLVLMGKNQLHYMNPNSTDPMQACRAYFELTDTGTGTVAAAKSFSFSIDGETTGVKVIDVNAPSTSINTRVYNMNGQLVGTSVENLPQGIYVIAGKKVVK